VSGPLSFLKGKTVIGSKNQVYQSITATFEEQKNGWEAIFIKKIL
jgi:hypothetical protein